MASGTPAFSLGERMPLSDAFGDLITYASAKLWALLHFAKQTHQSGQHRIPRKKKGR
jgi:hypothetical protein